MELLIWQDIEHTSTVRRGRSPKKGLELVKADLVIEPFPVSEEGNARLGDCNGLLVGSQRSK
jgi:hypothetical protein